MNEILRRVSQLRYMSLLISRWYVISLTCWWSLVWSRKSQEPAFNEKIVRWHNVFFSDSRGFYTYLFGLILGVFAEKSQVISHPIIVLASPISFLLNSFIYWFFSHSNVFMLLDLRMGSSTYTFKIIRSLFFWVIKIHESTLVGVKQILRKNLMSILF